jgi:putative sigma-54 modulation protein
MEMVLRHKHVPVGQALRKYVAEHVNTAFGKFADRIQRVTIFLADMNGPRGGVDKRCNIAVQLAKGRTIRSGNTNTHLVAAVYFATDRAAHAVQRALERRRKRARQKRTWDSDAD